MSLDHAMFDLAEETGAVCWRIYRWEPWCLSFGRHEPAARRFDRARIAELGLDCVRRPTGGRAVWHARELTYAVAAPFERYGSLRHAYRTIHDLLARAVATLGGAPSLAADRTTAGLGSGPCFDAAVGGELVIGGKKVLGSAQRRGTGALLQHGSLLLEDDQSLVRALHLTAGSEGPAPEAPLSAAVGRRIAFEEAAHAVAATVSLTGVPLLGREGPNEILGRAARHYDTYRSEQLTWER
jgi:lipoate-protein ligase A